MTRKPRKVRINRIRQGYTYTVAEVAKITTTHRNTVRHWLKTGLKTIDKLKPPYIRGSDLATYLRKKSNDRKQPCAPDEFPCFKCRTRRQALGSSVDVVFVNAARAQIKALCNQCATSMNKLSSVSGLADRLKAFDQIRLQNPHLMERLPISLNCYIDKDKET